MSVICKAILGSFYKGDQKFSDTVGIFCASNSLNTSFQSKDKKDPVWNSSDIDHILVEGGFFRKFSNKIDKLSAQISPLILHLCFSNF